MRTRAVRGRRSRRLQGYNQAPVIRPDVGYTGPVRLPTGDGRSTDSILVNLTYPAGKVVDSASEIKGYWANSDVISATDWSGFSSVYQEYRVLAFTVRWQNKYNQAYSATSLRLNGAMAVDKHASIAAPTTLDEVVQRSSYKLWNTGKPMSVTWRASGTEELTFTSTSGTSTHGGVVYYATGGTVASLEGIMYVDFVVEFRNRK